MLQFGATVPDGPVLYWHTGSWIWGPDLSSRQAYERYLPFVRPGIAVLIDTDEAEPRLLELWRDLNPLPDQYRLLRARHARLRRSRQGARSPMRPGVADHRRDAFVPRSLSLQFRARMTV